MTVCFLTLKLERDGSVQHGDNDVTNLANGEREFFL